MSHPPRERVFTFPAIAHCATCLRRPLKRHGREYLYRYRNDAPLVCGDDCARGRIIHMVAPPIRTTATGAALLHAAFDRDDTDEAPILLKRARAAGAVALQQHMATFIIDRTAGEAACTFHHLKSAGFTRAEITAHAAAAIARAGAECPDLRG